MLARGGGSSATASVFRYDTSVFRTVISRLAAANFALACMNCVGRTRHGLLARSLLCDSSTFDDVPD